MVSWKESHFESKQCLTCFEYLYYFIHNSLVQNNMTLWLCVRRDLTGRVEAWCLWRLLVIAQFLPITLFSCYLIRERLRWPSFSWQLLWNGHFTFPILRVVPLKRSTSLLSLDQNFPSIEWRAGLNPTSFKLSDSVVRKNTLFFLAYIQPWK